MRSQIVKKEKRGDDYNRDCLIIGEMRGSGVLTLEKA